MAISNSSIKKCPVSWQMSCFPAFFVEQTRIYNKRVHTFNNKCQMSLRNCCTKIEKDKDCVRACRPLQELTHSFSTLFSKHHFWPSSPLKCVPKTLKFQTISNQFRYCSKRPAAMAHRPRPSGHWRSWRIKTRKMSDIQEVWGCKRVFQMQRWAHNL